MRKLFQLFVIALLAVSIAGCGYSQKGKMPNDIKKLAVPTFTNVIKAKQIYSYESGLEVKLTNAIRDRILFDGTVKLTEQNAADAILVGKLTQYLQEPIGYDNLERVNRYRLIVATDITLKDLRTNKVIWREPNFTGEVIYNVSGGGDSFNQPQAAEDAIKRLARDIVDRMVEDW